jgi:inner membrane protein
MCPLEPITHFLTAACISRAGLNRKTGLATLTMVLAAEAPDMDVLAFLGGSVTGFQHHRGFTHTLLGAPVVAAAVVGGVYGIYRILLEARPGWKPKLPPRWKLLFVYAWLICLVHIFQDWTNSYGVRPLSPFNPRWYSWDIVSIIDPVMLGALFLGLVVPWLFALISEEVGARTNKFRGRGGAIFALIVLGAMILVRHVEHRRAVNALNSITYRGEDPLRVSAFPSSFNPFVWNGVVETRDFFELVPVDSGSGQIDPENQAIVRYKPEETPVTLAAKKSHLGRVYLDWAQYPLVEAEQLPRNEGYRVRFRDLRFTTVETYSHPAQPLAGYVELDPRLYVVDQYMGSPSRDRR